MSVDFDRLMRYAEQGKLRHSVHGDRDLHVWCYSQATVFTRDWDDLTLMCRGLVTDGEGTIVSQPFPKFFNWGEPLAPGPEITTLPFWAYDKMDGTLIVVGLDAVGDTVVSTKGSFDTWHSEAARKMLDGWKPVPGSTAIFEFIHPDNRIVVDYGEAEELVLLGAVAHSDRCDHFQPDQYAAESGWFGQLVTPRAFKLQQILQTIQDPENGPNREGFVVVWPNAEGPSHRVKLKFAQYTHLHAVLSRLSNVAVWEALSQGLFDALLEVVPDELYDKVRECADELNSKKAALLDAATEVVHAVSGLPDRKAQAEIVLRDAEHPALVFKLLDVRYDAADKIAWNIIRPERDVSWTFLR